MTYASWKCDNPRRTKNNILWNISNTSCGKINRRFVYISKYIPSHKQATCSLRGEREFKNFINQLQLMIVFSVVLKIHPSLDQLLLSMKIKQNETRIFNHSTCRSLDFIKLCLPLTWHENRHRFAWADGNFNTNTIFIIFSSLKLSKN